MSGMRPFTEDEQVRILPALETVRNQLLYLTGLYTGFRVTELLSLRVSDVLTDAGAPKTAITIARRLLKGGAGAYASRVRSRTVVMHPMLRAAISNFVRNTYGDGHVRMDDFLFQSRKGDNRPINKWTALRIIQRAAAKAGSAERVGTHSWRKTFVRAIYDGTGRDLVLTQKAVGHRSVLTTVRYLETSEDAVNAAVLGLKGPALRIPDQPERLTTAVDAAATAV